MTLTGFLIRIAFLALPGIVASTIYRTLIGTSIRKDWEDFREIALFALLSYSAYGLFQFIFDWLGIGHLTFTAIDALLNESVPLSLLEISLATLLGVVLAYTASAFYTFKLVNRIGRFLGVTRRFGDEDIWDYFHNTPSPGWLVIRDHKLNLTYFGWIQLFSDSQQRRELLLRDVSVYSTFDTSNLLYERDAIYLSRDYYDFTIEVPKKSSLQHQASTQKESSDDESEK